ARLARDGPGAVGAGLVRRPGPGRAGRPAGHAGPDRAARAGRLRGSPDRLRSGADRAAAASVAAVTVVLLVLALRLVAGLVGPHGVAVRLVVRGFGGVGRR